MTFTKTARYHEATNNMGHFNFWRYLPRKARKRLSTMMLQRTKIICVFHGISHEYHQNGSVPRCYNYNASSNLIFVASLSDENHQNSSGPGCYKWKILRAFFMVFPVKFIKPAQYHNARNCLRHLFFSRYFPWKSPKRLSTRMLQITDFICIFHDSSHELHQNRSVPRCYKWHALCQFVHEISHAFCHNGSVPRCYKWRTWSYIFMVFVPCNSPKRVRTTMLQITRVV